MRFAPYKEGGRTFIVPESLSELTPSPKGSQISKLSTYETPSIQTTFNYSKQLQQLLQGKQLLLDEISFHINEIHRHYLNGYITYHPSITLSNNQYHCVRCGNHEPHLFASFKCARCNEICFYCRKCIQLSRASECSPLIRWIGPESDYPTSTNPLEWEGELSKYQKNAADQIIKALQLQQDLLIWAVCGSGKTEMLFSGLSKALQMGLKVLLATPRTDVVIELTPRLKTAFPTTEIISLYGGSEDRHKSGQLTIATTHQLLRYYQAFDFIIIDEVDAFPYSFDKSLSYAVHQAKKSNSTTIYLTATPSKNLINEVSFVKVPRRYHGYPLPTPSFRWCGNWKKNLKKKKLARPLKKWLLQKKQQNKQIFLFVPSVLIQDDVTVILQKEGFLCSGVHAEDQDRHLKVQQFRDGQLQILVTTTILERGVTVANVDVAVLGSEEAIFTESALVQIAGRVGRSKDYPTGDIIFFHYGKTTEMVKAKKHIEAMNEVEL